MPCGRASQARWLAWQPSIRRLRSSTEATSAQKLGTMRRPSRSSPSMGGVAVGVTPLVHVEAVDMIAWNIPFLEEIEGPAVHAHWSYRQDQRQLTPRIAGPADLERDFVAHHGIEIGDRSAWNRLEIRMPPSLPLGDSIRVIRATSIDFLQIPSRGEEAVQHRPFERTHQIDSGVCHNRSFHIPANQRLAAGATSPILAA